MTHAIELHVDVSHCAGHARYRNVRRVDIRFALVGNRNNRRVCETGQHCFWTIGNDRTTDNAWPNGKDRRRCNRGDHYHTKRKGRFCPQNSSGRRSILLHNFYRVLVNRSTIAQKPPAPSHGNRTMTCKNIGFQRTFCD